MPTGDPCSTASRIRPTHHASMGGGIRANNYLLDGVPISSCAAAVQSDHRSAEEVEGAGPHLRRRDGTHRRRRAQRHREVGHQQLPRPGFTRRGWSGAAAELQLDRRATKEETGEDTVLPLHGGGAGGPVVGRTFSWRPPKATVPAPPGTTGDLADCQPAQRRLSRSTLNGTGGALQPVVPRRRANALPATDGIDCHRRPVHGWSSRSPIRR